MPQRLHDLQPTVSTVTEKVTRWLFAGSTATLWSVEVPDP
jgi:hypothetical protein